MAQTVLIVDDYPDSLDVWELFLTGAGFNVVTAATGLQALACITATRPDVIVSDLELPGMSGFELARRVRSHPSTSSIPLIAATGLSHGAQIEQAHKSGFDEVLVKPCDPDQLVRVIQRLTGRGSSNGAGEHRDATSR